MEESQEESKGRMRTPYAIYSSVILDRAVPDLPYSVWMRGQKTEYLVAHPEEERNQIDDHFFGDAQQRFFGWLNAKFPVD